MADPTFDNAFTMLEAMLAQWGLSELNGTVRDMLTAGDTAEVIPLKLRQTEAYKKRFSANEARIKSGLPALSEAEFLSTETALKGVMRRYVGAGKYDQREYTDGMISGDLSPQELEERMSGWNQLYQENARTAVDLPDGSRTTIGALWAQQGLTPQDALAGMIDPKITESELRRRGSAYALGAATVNAFGDPSSLNIGRLTDFVDRGADVNRAEAQLREAAAREDYEAFLAKSAGTALTRDDQMKDALLGDAGAGNLRRKVLDTDKARFGAQSYMGGGNKFGSERSGQY